MRLIGWTLTRTENALRESGFDGYGGGIALFLILALVWAGGISLAVAALPAGAASLVSVFLIYSLLALRDLLAAWLGRGARGGRRRPGGGAVRGLQAGGARYGDEWMAPRVRGRRSRA